MLSARTVTVKDSAGTILPAALLYVSPTQVNFLMPDGLVFGSATVTIASSATKQTATVQIAPVAPALFTLNSLQLAAAYAVRVDSNCSWRRRQWSAARAET
jgi:uncharacterized protein (TIGR03437 family)